MPKILVIDDEESFRKFLRQMLERAGYEVLDAADGKTGVALYREQEPNLVIVDILMPGKTGVDVIMELHRDFPGDKNIVAISGGGPERNLNYLAVAKGFGVKRTFQKPFNQRDFLAAIQELLPQ